jgi:hypothetical protein
MLFFLGRDLEMTIDRVLIWAGGPRLCAGTDFTGQHWLVFRIRSDREQSHWLCSPITHQALGQVQTGRATPRDALRHSSTGLVEVVSYVGGQVLPERCLRCGEIPEPFLPPADFKVTCCGGGEEPASANQSTARPGVSNDPPSRPDVHSRQPHPGVAAHPALCAAA